MNRPVLFALWALSACSYGEDRYLEERAVASCDFTVQCYPDLYASLEACLETIALGEGTDACAYDPVAARECVRGIEEMACPAEGDFPAFPEACDAVYTDCPGDG